jgi:hypothetical protein
VLRRFLVNLRGEHTGLDERSQVARVNLQNLVHLHGNEHHTVLHWDRAAAKVRAAAARDDFETFHVCEFQHVGDLMCGLDENDGFGFARHHRCRVVTVRDAFFT